MRISVVSPVYMAEKMVSTLVEQTSAALKELTKEFEIILVDDCSTDDSWQEILKQCDKNTFVKGLKLSRNFGQHNAIKAILKFYKLNEI